MQSNNRRTKKPQTHTPLKRNPKTKKPKPTTHQWHLALFSDRDLQTWQILPRPLLC